MSKTKLTTCKACGTPIFVTVKACPHCGAKNKKPLYKKAWFWILLVLALLVILGASGSSEESEAPSSISASNGQQSSSQREENTVPQAEKEPAIQDSAPEEAGKDFYQVGDTLQSGDLNIVYISSGEYLSGNEFLQPAEGNMFIFLEFAFQNTSSTSDASISIYNFEGYADGYSAKMQYFGEDTLSATLSAGRSTSGFLYFEVPETAQNIEIEYTANLFTEEKLKFAYEGNQDSGYTLEGGSQASPDAYQVGQTAESKHLKITYLACFQDSSGNQFIVPKDGCHFVTCEFEFENLSDSDHAISAFSFDCYADGIHCEQSFFRDDMLSATLSPGRKAKGTVTFEIPDSATIVEVEFLSNFWTSNRVVFSAKAQ